MTEKPFENLLGANLEVRNEQGELVFALKRKGEKYGKLYYIFELHQDRMDSEQLSKFLIMWELMKRISAKLELPLYDVNEVLEKIQQKVKDSKDTTIPVRGKGDIDVTIEITDQATGTTHKLVIGVSKQLQENKE